MFCRRPSRPFIAVFQPEIPVIRLPVQIIVSLLRHNPEAAFFVGLQGSGVLFAHAVAEPERPLRFHCVQDLRKEPDAVSLPSPVRARLQGLQVIRPLRNLTGPQSADPHAVLLKDPANGLRLLEELVFQKVQKSGLHHADGRLLVRLLRAEKVRVFQVAFGVDIHQLSLVQRLTVCDFQQHLFSSCFRLSRLCVISPAP